jgi:hypothetical protein
MTFFMGDREQNTIPDAGTELSAGPGMTPEPTPGVDTGFLANFWAAYHEQVHVRSAFGAEQDMAALEQQQLDQLYDRTGERMAPLFPGAFYSPTNPTGPYQMDIMHVLAGDTGSFTPAQASQMQQEYVQTAQKQIDRYNKLASANGLLTYDQMFKSIRDRAAKYVDADAATGNQATFGGVIGGIAGGIAGSLNPAYDPVNLATVALGGVGKTALVRTASDIGMAGLSQAAQLMTGGYDNQQLLDQAPTGGQMAEQVATAALGAGVLRGGGEAAAVGFHAIAQRFGAKAADVTVGAVAHEAEGAIGPSPYGTSRAAQGLHEAEVLDAIKRDLPMNMAVSAVPADVSPFAAPAFATHATDNLFAGTSTPLANIFDRVPETPAMDAANAKIADATGRVAEANKAVADLGEQIAARQNDLLPAKDLADLQARAALLDEQIADNAGDLRRLGQLNKDRAALVDKIGEQAAINSDLETLGQQRELATAQGNNLRLARASLVEDAARGAPGVNRSEMVRRLIGDIDPSGRRPIDGPPPTRATSEQLERDIAAPIKAEPSTPRIIPAAMPDENGKLPTGASGRDMVDLGQHSRPVDLDMPVHLGEFDFDGNPVLTTIRQVLQDHADDDALVKSMRECLVVWPAAGSLHFNEGEV